MKNRNLIITKQNILNFLPDKLYLEWLFKKVFGKKLDLKKPETFNEKIQWLKLYDRQEKYINLVDKYEVKKYVTEIIGPEHIVPTLGVWNCFEDIDFSVLPNQFVLKCTHDSGGTIIVKDKNNFNYNDAKEKIEKCLSRNYYYIGREWPYKNVKPRIIAEKYLSNGKEDDICDFKFLCFGGRVKCSFVCSDRHSEKGLHVTFYDLNWHVMPFERGYPRSERPLEKPKNYDLMISYAEKLSVGIPFVRIDYYEIEGKLYFGEFTFYPGGGIEQFNPVFWDRKLGEWIDLDLVKRR